MVGELFKMQLSQITANMAAPRFGLRGPESKYGSRKARRKVFRGGMRQNGPLTRAGFCHRPQTPYFGYKFILNLLCNI